MNIAVIMTCHNRVKNTLACLDCLFSQQYIEDIKLEVYLVDDGSDDDTGKLVKEKFSEVNVIDGDGTLFWNQGMLKAWSVAAQTEHDFFLWLNDDTNIENDAVATVLKDYQNCQNKNSIIVGATKSQKTGETTYSGRVSRQGVIVPNGSLQMCEEFNGNFVLIPKCVFDKIGVLDSYFRHSLGDIEYSMRAKKNGIECLVASKHIGYCENNIVKPKWKNSEYNLKKRLQMMYSPLGLNPFEMFHLNLLYNGLFVALVVFFKNHLRCIFAIENR